MKYTSHIAQEYNYDIFDSLEIEFVFRYFVKVNERFCTTDELTRYVDNDYKKYFWFDTSDRSKNHSWISCARWPAFLEEVDCDFVE